MPRDRTNTVTVRFEGPFFTGNPIDKLADNTRDVMEQIAEWGEARVKERIGSAGSGRTRNSYRGRVVSLGGKKWRRTAVISPNTTGLSAKEAISLMAGAHELEYGHAKNRTRHDPLGKGRGGKHAVSRTKTELNRWRKGFPDLLKGLT